MQQLRKIQLTLADRHCRNFSIRVALMVGTLLFIINHGGALMAGEMDAQRWLSAILTYGVPFMVSIHGQSTCQIG